MGLRNYMSELAAQSDADVIYSKNPEPVTKIIPPVSSSKKENTKVIPPTSGNKVKIKFTGISLVTPKFSTPAKKDIKINVTKKEDKQPIQKEQKQQTVSQAKKESENEIIDRLFIASETNNKFKNAWVENYKLANSGKSLGKGIDVGKVKAGKFQIDEVEGHIQLIILPDYEIRGKNSKTMLNEKWLKK